MAKGGLFGALVTDENMAAIIHVGNQAELQQLSCCAPLQQLLTFNLLWWQRPESRINAMRRYEE